MFATTATAEPIRIATFNTELSRKGPGLLLADIRKGDDPQLIAIVAVIDAAGADVLALQGFDWDLDNTALGALNDQFATPFPHLFAVQPNTGLATGVDLDGDGRNGHSRDVQGYGRFAGQGGMAVLSRLPLGTVDFKDFTTLLWKDLPGATLPKYGDGAPFPSMRAQAIQRISTTAHWAIVLETRAGPLTLLTFHASPPVFDGPEDPNGLRNADEIRLWQAYLDGELGPSAPIGPFVIAGDANLDGNDGDGQRHAIKSLLNDARFQDPRPTSGGGVLAAKVQAGANLGHTGPAAMDTADWPDGGTGPGNLRVDYVLPSSDLTVTGSGVIWPGDAQSPLGMAVSVASRHRLVWVDIDF